MIAVDTNVLLRYITRDDPLQFARAEQFFESELSPLVPGYVSLIVICEIVWSLDRTYGLPPAAIRHALAALIESPQLQIEKCDIVRQAIAQTACGIADAVIHLAGIADGCTATVTFDRKFARLDGVELLA